MGYVNIRVTKNLDGTEVQSHWWMVYFQRQEEMCLNSENC